MSYVFDAPRIPSLTVAGAQTRFPVHRIYCIGRNYAEHAKEMGASVDKEQPIFFMKPADAIVEDGAAIPYPPATQNLHHEVELVAAIGRGGRDIAVERALEHVFGYAVGVDLTRRDLQAQAKKNGAPWDTAKGFDRSAPVSAIVPATELAHPSGGAIWLDVDGSRKQSADLSEMVHSVAEIVALLSRLFELMPGDLVFCGTPAGVGPLERGQRFEAGIGERLRLSGRIG
jgi:fumarylpyruvate hydrolase